MTEEDERVMSMFMASDAAPQRTLADIIMERINDKGGDAMVAAEEEGALRLFVNIRNNVTCETSTCIFRMHSICLY